MRDNKLFAKQSKCSFAMKKVEYLGHVITGEEVATNPSKIEAIKKLASSFYTQTIEGIFGIRYYRRFIKSFAMVSQPLNALLKKNSFKWSNAAEVAFVKLKQVMMEAPVLGLPDFDQEFVIETDASCNGIGVIFKIKTDHFRLKYLLSQKLTTPFQLKWVPKLLGYDYEIVYRRGVDNAAANALSRANQGAELLPTVVSSVASDVMDKRKGVLVTTKKLNVVLYWKGLKRMVRKFFKECDTCQRQKPDLSAYLGLLQPLPIPERIWTQVTMDFIEKLPNSQGKTGIMVVVDRLSKYAHFMPLAHPFSASQIAQVFLDRVYKLHGLPESIVSDRDKVFLNNFWKSFFSTLNVKLKLSTAYHPQFDGQTEVVNRCLGFYMICIAINTTPYEVVYCQTPPIHIPYTPGDSRVETVDRTFQSREEAINMLTFHIKRAQDRMRSQANKHMTDREFEVGTWVYLKLQPHRQVIMRQGQQHKLSAKYHGPFMIVERIRKVACKLQLPSHSQIHPVFHISQLKKCHGKGQQMGSLPQLREDGLLVYKPMTILERRLGKVNNKPVMYVLIQWTNRPVEEATWEIYVDVLARFPNFDAA
ncbi:retrotransposon-related protein [Tanacetum coccineum]